MEASSFLGSGEPADLMLMDIRMPGRSGLEVMQELEKPPPFPVIAMTGQVEYDMQNEYR